MSLPNEYTILDHLPDSVLIIDRDYTIVFANQSFCDLSATTSDKITGKKCHEILHHSPFACTSTGVPDQQCVHRQVFATGLPVVVRHSHTLPDGTKKFLQVSATPLLDKDGTIIRLMSVIKDCTQEKGLQDALDSTTAEYGAILRNIPFYLTYIDSEMRVIRINPPMEEFIGWKSDTIKGRYCYDVWGQYAHAPDKKDKERICDVCKVQNTLVDGQTYSYEKEIGDRYVKITTCPVRDKNGHIVGAVEYGVDITEQKRLKEELFQAHKLEAIGTLAGGIAHDFNNILSAILGYAELAKQNLPPETAALDDIDQVITAGQRASALVQQILDFSHKEEQQLQPVQPHLIVQETLQMLRSTLPTTIEILVDIDPASGTVMADPTKLHQVIMNLCTNAFHAMKDEKGILKVALYRQERAAEEGKKEGMATGPYIVLSVSDTGRGMDQETAAHIFEPYFTTKERGRGTGLGLAVVHGIIEGYKGFTQVENKPGQGCTFRVFIPALAEEHPIPEKPEQQESLPVGTERILVVDDEPLLVHISQRILENYGYTVTGVTNSIEALEKVQADPQQFDLIITDQTMPGLSGSELTKAILQVAPLMPIILCTGHSEIASADDAYALGIKKYLSKPIHGDELARTVRMVLDEQKKL